MKVVKRTAEFTIYQKRSERYAVQSADKKWVNGDDKARILLDAGLIKVTLPKPPEPEAPAEEAAAETDDSAAAAEQDGEEGADAAAES